MKLRYIPFGYRLSGGSIKEHEMEAELVRTIFKQYIAGQSYSRIASELEASEIPYNDSASRWNKNMVGRILQNRKYTGQDNYLPLIAEDDFEQAALIQQEKYTRKNIQTTPEINALKEKAVCGECGAPYERILDSRIGERWKCKNTKCSPKVKITDSYLNTQVISLLNRVIENPLELEMPSTVTELHNLEITRLNNEINRELDKPDCNEDYAKNLIMALAALRYEHCPDTLLSEKAKKLTEILKYHAPMTELDYTLFLQTADAVMIHLDGTVILKLITGQILQNTEERSNLPCKQPNA